MNLHLSEHLPESDEVSGYSKSSGISETIIMIGVIYFLTALVVLGIICAFSSYYKVKIPKEEYVVQSAFIEVIP